MKGSIGAVIVVVVVAILFFVVGHHHGLSKRHARRLQGEIRAEVRPSPIHGVGVFAIMDIPAGEILFRGVESDTIPLDDDDLEDTLSEEQHRVFSKLSDYRNGKAWTTRNFNLLPITSFFNHAPSPESNITWHAPANAWRVTKDIKENEEMLWDYRESNNEDDYVYLLNVGSSNI